MMKLEDYPIDSWRTHQLDYAQQVLHLATSGATGRAGLQGPCGCGKSIGYLRPLLDPRSPKSIVLTTTRQHLAQLEATLQQYWPGSKDWAIIRGRSFYTCCGKKPAAAVKNPILAEDYNAEEQWADPEEASERKGGSCPLGDDRCLYRSAVRAAAEAQVVLQCTIGGLYRKQAWGELEVPELAAPGDDRALKRKAWILSRRQCVDRSVVVLDEAHEYLRVRRDFETTRLELWMRGIFDERRVAALQAARTRQGSTYRSSYVLLEPDSALRLMLLAEFDRLLEPSNVERMLPAGKHLDNRDQVKAAWIRKLEARKSMLSTGDVVSVQWSWVGQVEKAELVAEPLFAHVADKLADIEIFTSATLTSVAPLLKIPKENVLAYPEVFDWASKVTTCPLEDNADGSQRSMALDAETIEQIYQAEDRPLTVCLFLSKKQAHEAAKKVADKPKVYIQGWGPGNELGELVESIRNAEYFEQLRNITQVPTTPTEEDDDISF